VHGSARHQWYRLVTLSNQCGSPCLSSRADGSWDAGRLFAAINANYERHCRAAREIAEAHFDSRRSLETILNVALSAHVSVAAGR
jgi:hypothetical protein